MLSVTARTHPGAVRQTNQDCVLWDAALSLLVAADGMGGHNAGDVASRAAVETIRLFLEKSGTDEACTWPFGIDPALSLDKNRLRTAIQLANRRVFREAEQRVEYTGMGTTVVAALVSGGQVIFVNVGDSRLYAIEAGGLRQLTRDDSWAAMLARESSLDAAAIARHPMRNVLTSVIGARPELDPVVGEFALAPGQGLLLCTDGLYTALGDERMHAIVAAEPDLERAADALVQAALDARCDDNVGLVLARYTAD